MRKLAGADDPFRVPRAHRFGWRRRARVVDAHSVRESGLFAALMPLVGRDEADPAMWMLGIVPCIERCHPRARSFEGRKRFMWVLEHGTSAYGRGLR